MGIKGLWTVLSPFSEKKSLHEIQGETIAVDLSGWVCDSQNVTDYYIQPKLYLRTVYLILADINPIFVLEGDAPELKRDVMAARNAIQFKGAAPRSDTVSTKRPDVGRKRFKGVLKECETLLRYMGVRCVKGRGEAEATCAQLNSQGACIFLELLAINYKQWQIYFTLVDTVVSQDSDCFAYGARRVYRNFSVSNSAGGGAMQGSVDCYDADVMFRSNGFGRNKMVALAILCGCDYGIGACGSSITTVVSFLHTIPDSEAIPRLLTWVSSPEQYEQQARWAAAPGRCDRCGHVGRTHLKNGCPVCATHRGCKDLGHKSKVSEVKRELSLRNRALSCGVPFPEPKVMKEFLNATPEKIDLDSLKYPVPSLIQFVKLMSNKLDWSERYCVEKFLPVLTKWHLQDNVPNRTIKPIVIKKKRVPRGVPSFEVVWADIDGQYEALIPDELFEEDEDHSKPWTTTERQDLMRQYHPELVEAFEESIKKPPKVKKPRATKNKDGADKPKRKYNRKVKKLIDVEIANLSGSLKNLDLTAKTAEINSSKNNVSVCVNKLKRKFKSTKGRQKTIDSFIAKKKRKSIEKAMHSLKCSLNNISLNEPNELVHSDNMCDKENSSDIVHLLSTSCASGDDIHESDLSDLVDKIVKRSPSTKTARVENNLVKLIFDNKFSTPKKIRNSVLKQANYFSTPKESPIRRNSFKFCVNNSNVSAQCKANTSYFFDKLTEDRDAFEMSLEYKHKSAIISLDCDTTVEYSLPDVCL